MLVWRYIGGQTSDYGNNGLIYAGGLFNKTYPELNPSGGDDGDPFPGVAGIKVLSPWSDSRDPYGFDGGINHNNIYVPDTKPSSNVGMEVLGQNPTAGYITVKLYAANPENASPSKPKNLVLTVVGPTGQGHPRLTWSANAEPDMASYKIYRAWGIGGTYYLLATVSVPTTTYDDNSIHVGNYDTAYYKITAVDNQSLESIFSDAVWFRSNVQHKIFAGPAEVPSDFAMGQNYPNPFNPSTRLQYQLAEDSHVALRLYDILGREIRTLVDEQEQAGYYELAIDGSQLASGVYFARLVATDGLGQVKLAAVNKLILMK